MSWGGGVGSGNLLMAATDRLAAGIASISNLGGITSLSLSSGFIVQTAANVGGSADAIVGRPAFYHQIDFGGTNYLVPIYRKT